MTRLDMTPGFGGVKKTGFGLRLDLRIPALAGFASGVLVLAWLGGVGLALAAGILLATALHVLLKYLGQQKVRKLQQEIADACNCLACEISAGQPAVLALKAASEEYGILRTGASQVALGGDPCQGWKIQAEQPGCAGLGKLAAAWKTCVTTGAPLAPSLDAVAQELAANQALAQTVRQELAAARATGHVMAFLPAFGAFLGFLMGGDPIAFLLESALGQICLVVGVGFACLGVLWTERIVDCADNTKE